VRDRPPGFWRGLLRGLASFDLAGRLPPLDLPSDEEALAADWRAVEDSLRAAMTTFATKEEDR
jgi:hypothetical protein